MAQIWTPGFTNGAAAQLWTAPVGTVRPADTSALYPALPAPWVTPGSTVDGYETGSNVNVTEWKIEEQDNPVKRRKQRTIGVKATLAEATLVNYKLAQGGGTLTAVASGTAPVTPAKMVYRFTDDSDEIAVILDSVGSPDPVTGISRALRLYIPRADAAGSVTDKYRRTADYRQFTLEIAALCPGSQIELYEIAAA